MAALPAANTGCALARSIEVRGVVQGVGFRPHVYRLAKAHGLSGEVVNTPEGARLHIEGAPEAIADFLHQFPRDLPPFCRIDQLQVEDAALTGLEAFRIGASTQSGAIAAQMLPDLAICSDCLSELNDPKDRRYRYPFINCTHCGPRYSLITGLPYDRPNTTMRGFTMCDACRVEYEDPADRRFHAQPIACPDCGPQLALWDAQGAVVSERDDALLAAAEAVRQGKILALKGLGGFQFIVDAASEEAVQRLRARKGREAKPLALMVPDLPAAEMLCDVGAVERAALRSAEAPIVLLRRKGRAGIAPAVAPGLNALGLMLPCTPLHVLFMQAMQRPVVATSGNISDEPLCIDEREALERLGGIADLFLVHNRPIHRPVDDSVARVIDGRLVVLRRARGFAPTPVAVSCAGPDVAAVGGHMKNTVGVLKGGLAVISQHVGDLDTLAARARAEQTLHDLAGVYEIEAAAAGCDMHPDYGSTALAAKLGLPAVPVQHHEAHVLACMAEHGLQGPVLGVSWDGTGYGGDGTVWGGEFLRVSLEKGMRVGTLLPFWLPGGERAVREPRRCALAVLLGLGEGVPDDWQPGWTPTELEQVRLLLRKGLNSPPTTSAGRFFDAAASLLGLCHINAYEGQAGTLLEAAAEDAQDTTPLAPPVWIKVEELPRMDWRPMLRSMLAAKAEGVSVGALARGFHAALAGAIAAFAMRQPLRQVVLTGGCFQNALLSRLARERLETAGFEVFQHERVPPNDGGLALGQLVRARMAAASQGEERCV